MRENDLAHLNSITRESLEITLELHTTERVKVNKYTEFTWSISRNNLYEWCRRKYYLNYYGARRVREAKDRAISAVWWLKQAVPRNVWIGTVLHYIAQRALQALRDGREIPAAQLVEEATAYYRGGVQASKRGVKFDGQWVSLVEDIYPDTPPSIDIDEAEMRVHDLAQNFIESEAYDFIKSLPVNAIKEIDQPFQTFDLKDVPVLGRLRVFAVPDVLLKLDNEVQIIDWKTGNVESQSINMQAGIYRLYAHLKYGNPEEEITVYIADLNNGQNVPPPGGTPTLGEAESFMRNSIQSMLDNMDDIFYNTVSIRNYPMTPDTGKCQHCSFKRVCWRHEGANEQ